MDRARPFPLGWSIFLACSWTWCIGMYLPVLLVRDFGIAGWVVFAIPNVIGAALMGWIVRSPAMSESIVARHRTACLAFSFVTIAFQWYFAAWALGPIVIALATLALVVPMMGRGSAGSRAAAIIVYFVSIVALLTFVAQGEAFRGIEPTLAHPHRAMIELAFLAPVCVFGFALCPYLDLTFHRARQELDDARAARFAFGFGFGALFLVMILFTLAYAGLMKGDFQPARQLARIAIVVHFGVQLGFTIAAHLRESIARSPQAMVPVFFLGAAALGVLPVVLLHERNVIYHGLTGEEVAYRAFMGFYGLVFPAYVWLRMVPRRRANLGAFWIAVIVAAPMFWIGFIEQRPAWLIPGLLVVFAAGLISPRTEPAS